MCFFILLLSLLCLSTIAIAETPLLNPRDAREEFAEKDIIYGRSQSKIAFTTNDEGFTRPTNIARISLEEQTLAQTSDLLRQQFTQHNIFDKEQFSFTISTAPTI